MKIIVLFVGYQWTNASQNTKGDKVVNAAKRLGSQAARRPSDKVFRRPRQPGGQAIRRPSDEAARRPRRPGGQGGQGAK